MLSHSPVDADHPSVRPMRSNAYAELLRESRGLRRDRNDAREAWFASLGSPAKAATLFEFETLLKGIGAFGNQRNVPGPRPSGEVAVRDHRERLGALRQAAHRCIELSGELLEGDDEPYAFSRYVETVLSDDVEHSRLSKEQLVQDTPIAALCVLRDGLASLADVLDGLLVSGPVSVRLATAIHAQFVREISRNVFFNPLIALEFRREFDRINHTDVLDALERVPSENAHRVVALAFLSLFRNLRYLDLIDSYVASADRVGLAYVVLGVLRSDLRSLTRFLSRRAGTLIADGFERELLTVPATNLQSAESSLSRISNTLLALRRALESASNTVRIEVRRVFDHRLPSPEEARNEDTAPALREAVNCLRGVLALAISSIVTEILPETTTADLAPELDPEPATSDRLRRDVWIFSQVLRAFVAKADTAQLDASRWSASTNFRFVHEFLGHFRAIGYQLVRKNDYDRLQPFLHALGVLRATDLLDSGRLATASQECRRLSQYLDALFDRLNRRSELSAVPFDKRAAADTLRIYLGALS